MGDRPLAILPTTLAVAPVCVLCLLIPALASGTLVISLGWFANSWLWSGGIAVVVIALVVLVLKLRQRAGHPSKRETGLNEVAQSTGGFE